tara:strand:+ start:11107 stop:11442 length:336 start_codon:yes stop_codon:yes gene_type:complete
MLNQLRSEVKKYPLKKKKNKFTINSDINKSKPKESVTQEVGYAKNTNNNDESISNESNISFNNSKNFSIYNNISNDFSKNEKGSTLQDKGKSDEKSSSLTFKDRLDQIDMK